MQLLTLQRENESYLLKQKSGNPQLYNYCNCMEQTANQM